MTDRGAIAAGGVAGALGVGLGAFGAHGLRGTLSPADLAVFETAVRYQLAHALALLGVGALLRQRPDRRLSWAATLFVVGLLLFAGSLYALVLLDLRWLGAVTPFGGAALIAGWVLIAASAWTPAER